MTALLAPHIGTSPPNSRVAYLPITFEDFNQPAADRKAKERLTTVATAVGLGEDFGSRNHSVKLAARDEAVNLISPHETL